MNAQKRRVRYRGGVRRIIILMLVILAALLLLVGLAPTLVSMGLAHGVIEGKLNDAVTGEARFASIQASWFSQQSLTGVTIDHAEGQRVADVDVTLEASLLGLLFGSVDAYDITLTGAMETDIREDGSSTLLEAVMPPVPSTEPLAQVFRVTMDSVELTVNDDVSGESLRISPNHARVRVEPGGTIVAAIEAEATAGDETGDLTINLQGYGLPMLGNASIAGGSLYAEIKSSLLPLIRADPAERLSDLVVSIECDPLDTDAAIKAVATVHSTVDGQSRAVPVTIDLLARGWMLPDGTLEPALDRLSGTIHAMQTPTALLQPLVADTGIDLGRDVGEFADIEISIPNEPDGVTIATLKSALADARITGVLGADTVSIHESEFTAAVSPGLREHFLKPINPILADIRHTSERIRVTTSGMTLPLDGDLSKVNGTVTLTIGDVQFDPGSLTFALLDAFNESDAAIAGHIQPVAVTIVDGVVSYDLFSVRIDRYTMNYTGAVNLMEKSVDLRTEIPLSGLAHTFRELEGYAEHISVPLVTRGTFGGLQTKIDPEFDLARAAAQAGVRGGLGDLLKDIDILGDDDKDKAGALGGLIDDLLRGGRRRGGGG